MSHPRRNFTSTLVPTISVVLLTWTLPYGNQNQPTLPTPNNHTPAAAPR